MMPHIFRALLEYHQTLNRRVWESIQHLTDEQFIQPLAYSHGSIRNQMVHMVVEEARWLRGLRELPDARTFTLNPEDYPTRQSVRTLWEATSQEVWAFGDSLDEADLSRTPTGMLGPVWQVLVHLVNHGTDHRAQVLRALHDLGAPTFDQDLVLYLWSR